jgi:hypothetical protein
MILREPELVQEQVEEHMVEELPNVSEFAAELGVSDRYLRRIIDELELALEAHPSKMNSKAISPEQQRQIRQRMGKVEPEPMPEQVPEVVEGEVVKMTVRSMPQLDAMSIPRIDATDAIEYLQSQLTVLCDAAMYNDDESFNAELEQADIRGQVKGLKLAVTENQAKVRAYTVAQQQVNSQHVQHVARSVGEATTCPK